MAMESIVPVSDAPENTCSAVFKIQFKEFFKPNLHWTMYDRNFDLKNLNYYIIYISMTLKIIELCCLDFCMNIT